MTHEDIEFELCCKNCGRLFYSHDENLVYCKECWQAYIKSHEKNWVDIRLTEEYVDELMKENNNDCL